MDKVKDKILRKVWLEKEKKKEKKECEIRNRGKNQDKCNKAAVNIVIYSGITLR